MSVKEIWQWQIDFDALIILVLLFLFFIFLLGRRTRLLPYQGYSKVFYSFMPCAAVAKRKTWRLYWSSKNHLFLKLCVLFLSVAFLQPSVFLLKAPVSDLVKQEKNNVNDLQEKELPVEGLGIFLALDQSGSMQTPVGSIKGKPLSRMDLLKLLAIDFLSADGLKGYTKRSHDMVGLASFARYAKILSPLTLDRQALIKEIEGLDTVQQAQEDGTNISYAIYKLSYYIKALREQLVSFPNQKDLYRYVGQTIILITDGLHAPHPEDSQDELRGISLEQAANFAKKTGIRLYIINLEPRVNNRAYAHQLRELREASAITDGQFYLLSDPTGLSQVLEDIERLEKNKWNMKVHVKNDSKKSHPQKELESDNFEKKELYPYFLFLSIVCLLLYYALENLWVDRFK